MKEIFQPLFVVIWCLILVSCADEASTPAVDSATQPTVVEVTAVYDPVTNRHLFKTDVTSVPAGWTTFRLTNASPVLHFLFLEQLPGARTSVDLLSEVSPIFQDVADLNAEGKIEEANAKFADLPDWFQEIVFRGGPGFLSPGHTGEATLYLEPGNYMMECYIKNADGVFHWNLGMHLDLLVTDEVSDAEPPSDPTVEFTITDDGLAVDGTPRVGENLVAVHFQQQSHPLIAKDVHVVRVGDGVDLDATAHWMDAFQADGLISTPENPAPAVFLGGVHEMPLGDTAYFPVTLEAGDYAWISEQPAAEATYLRFTVPAEGAAAEAGD